MAYENKTTTANSSPDESNQDVLPTDVIWTPAIEVLGCQVSRWIRMDLPGGAVFGAQRCGKTWACWYLEDALASIVGYPLASIVGYPLAVFVWSIPEDSSYALGRVFVQERLSDSGCQSLKHRDLGVLRMRLFDHLLQCADEMGARRVVIIVDEAQNLKRDHYAFLIYSFNQLEKRHLRPFVLLVGQPELTGTTYSWMQAMGNQVVGRFFSCRHEFKGIFLGDLEVVFDAYEGGGGEAEIQPISPFLGPAYADGWRLRNLAPLVRDAVLMLKSKHNIKGDVRMPMQYFRATLVAVLEYLAEAKLHPQVLQLANVVECVVSTGFVGVMSHYVDAPPAEASFEDAKNAQASKKSGEHNSKA